MGAVRIRHSIWEIATHPVILWTLLGGKPKWLPLNFEFNDVMRTAPNFTMDYIWDTCHENKKKKRSVHVRFCMKTAEMCFSKLCVNFGRSYGYKFIVLKINTLNCQEVSSP